MSMTGEIKVMEEPLTVSESVRVKFGMVAWRLGTTAMMTARKTRAVIPAMASCRGLKKAASSRFSLADNGALPLASPLISASGWFLIMPISRSRA